MKTSILVIGVIKKGDKVLLRKKPDGSPPYKETWYLFGGEVSAEHPNAEEALCEKVREQAGIEIKPVERVWWDTEIKPDLEGKETFYVYLDYVGEYVSGELSAASGIEKLEWVSIERLREYDLVPPSVKLFKKIGYLE